MKKILPAGLFSLFILLISSFEMHTIAQGIPQPGKSSITEVIAPITLEEKAKLVGGNGFHMPSANPDGTLIGQTQDKMSGASGTTFAIPRFGIPSIVVSNGPAGLRIDSIRNGDSAKTLKKPGSGETGFIYELNNFLAIGQ